MAQDTLISAIERFLAETGMGASYFGQKAVKNSKLVARLREGRPVETDTESAVRAFMDDEREDRRKRGLQLLGVQAEELEVSADDAGPYADAPTDADGPQQSVADAPAAGEAA